MIVALSTILTELSQPDPETGAHKVALQYELEDHIEPIGCLAWSPDDSILLTAADHTISLWDSKVRGILCQRLANKSS